MKLAKEPLENGREERRDFILAVSLVPGSARFSTEVTVKTSPTMLEGIATFSSLMEACFFALAFFTILDTSSSSWLLGWAAAKRNEKKKKMIRCSGKSIQVIIERETRGKILERAYPLGC